MWIKFDPVAWFDKTVKLLFAFILLFLIFGLLVGAAQLFVNLKELVSAPGITGRYLGIITDVLTLFILVELSRSLVSYFSEERLRLTFIVDA